MNQKQGKKKKSSLSENLLMAAITIAVVCLLIAIIIPNFISYRGSGSPQNQSIYLEDFDSESLPIRSESFEPVSGKSVFNTEEYDRIYENRFKDTAQNPLSTFSIDVDTASYSNVRRYIRANNMPPKDAVRIEEMINYFTYEYPQPDGEHPIFIETEISNCPWNLNNKLFHIGLQGREPDLRELKPNNLVFLIDSSGSMVSSEKLLLLKKAFRLLIGELTDKDGVAIVTYAGSAGLVLPFTSVSEKNKILSSLDNLQAGGSTAGGAGITLAYKVARENYIRNGNNRVILATDGDFNVGVSSTAELVRLIEDGRESDIYLTICGFGMGNYKDGRMEQISNAGNGNYFYIDNIKEAQKVFVTQLRASLFTIAKDVKIQVEFNPVMVRAYRLIGYENRILAAEDFNDDMTDAGEMGPGHTVTALYEIIPADSSQTVRTRDSLKYQEQTVTAAASSSNEILTIKLRYKYPKEESSRMIHTSVIDEDLSFQNTSENFRFSAAVAGFGMLLRDSRFKEDLTFQEIISIASDSIGDDINGYRSEFIDLVETCHLLDG